MLINAAGFGTFAPLENADPATQEALVAVGLVAPVRLTMAVLPAMRGAGSGHIVNITSTAAKRAWANASAYHASKWGLLGFSYALHSELRPHGVRVCAVVAGGRFLALS